MHVIDEVLGFQIFHLQKHNQSCLNIYSIIVILFFFILVIGYYQTQQPLTTMQKATTAAKRTNKTFTLIHASVKNVEYHDAKH